MGIASTTFVPNGNHISVVGKSHLGSFIRVGYHPKARKDMYCCVYCDNGSNHYLIILANLIRHKGQLYFITWKSLEGRALSMGWANSMWWTVLFQNSPAFKHLMWSLEISLRRGIMVPLKIPDFFYIYTYMTGAVETCYVTRESRIKSNRDRRKTNLRHPDENPRRPKRNRAYQSKYLADNSRFWL